SALLAKRRDISVLSHGENQGYGGALVSAFEYAIKNDFDVLVTIDCDGQHEPQRIPDFVEACLQLNVDIVSGSRYLEEFAGDSSAPEQRRRVNQIITAELNERLGLRLTDAFCGFKAYRVSQLKKLNISETGYAMPLELWVHVAHAGLQVVERPVPRIYLDNTRSFGGELDDMSVRLDYYHLVINRALDAVDTSAGKCGVGCGGVRNKPE
ncbi:MAG: glycosyltransferase family 2 protein, partial [Planctomycetales bacterium]|nr:glycosyltransferase family 2 protein [Planctomycetales bacterium]